MPSPKTLVRFLGVVSLLIPLLAPAARGQGVAFDDLAADPAAGLTYVHGDSPRQPIVDQLRSQPFLFPFDIAKVPHKPNGAPGVALLDFDGDGDLDLYATRNQGESNTLFANQLADSGQFRFVDVAAAAGVAAMDHDSTGVCWGDVDNDGDPDLYVLGAISPNRLFENQGDGTFTDITATAGVGGGDRSTSSCSMGDVDGDGLLDIAVANTHDDWNDLLGIVVPFAFAEHNQLFVNQGGNTFVDASAASGFETLAGLPPFAAGSAGLTWAIALVDFDQDGDLDAVTLDDQGGVPHPFQGGVDYGLIHLHVNDGSGHFVDRTVEAGLDLPGNWMGVAFGDLDCDGHLDFFATNVGDYPPNNTAPAFPLGVLASRWFLGNGDGTFADPGVGSLIATPFGWGTAILDADNDGDPDVAFHGAIDVVTLQDAGNPGVLLLNNGCSADYGFDPALTAVDHTRRIGQGLAAGDLDADGRVDVVTVSNADAGPSVPLTKRTFTTGSMFDAFSFFIESFEPDPANPGFLLWNGIDLGAGSLAVQMNRSEPHRPAVVVDPVGTVGLASRGAVNRDGVGAVVRFVPDSGGPAQTVPIVAGGSYASQGELVAHFGAPGGGMVEILWPGGVRNRLRGVAPGERLVFPEIPCSVDDAFAPRSAYVRCVVESLGELQAAGLLTAAQRARFQASALAP